MYFLWDLLKLLFQFFLCSVKKLTILTIIRFIFKFILLFATLKTMSKYIRFGPDFLLNREKILEVCCLQYEGDKFERRLENETHPMPIYYAIRVIYAHIENQKYFVMIVNIIVMLAETHIFINITQQKKRWRMIESCLLIVRMLTLSSLLSGYKN